MKHITIKRVEQADVDAIMQLMQEAVDTVKVSDWFLPDNRQYIEEHISDRGFTLKALSSNNEILGFFIVDLPGESKHNLGYDLFMTGGTDFHGLYTKTPYPLGSFLCPKEGLHRLILAGEQANKAFYEKHPKFKK